MGTIKTDEKKTCIFMLTMFAYLDLRDFQTRGHNYESISSFLITFIFGAQKKHLNDEQENNHKFMHIYVLGVYSI